MRNVCLLTLLLLAVTAFFPMMHPSNGKAQQQYVPTVTYLELPTVYSVFPSDSVVTTPTVQYRQQVVCNGNSCSVVNVPVATNTASTVGYVTRTTVFSSNMRSNNLGLVRGQPLRNLGRRLFGRCRCR